MSLKSFLVVESSASPSLLFQYFAPTCAQGLREESKSVASKAKLVATKVGQRQKLVSDFGKWYLLRGQVNLIFAACVEQDYPERTAFGLIQKVESLISEKEGQSLEKRVKAVQRQISVVCERYKNSSGVDKVKEAQAAVGELRQQLTRGVKNMISNKDNLQQINDKAALMKNYAKNFEKNAEEVEKVMCWRKWKFFIVLGIVLAVVLLSSGLILYLKTH